VHRSRQVFVRQSGQRRPDRGRARRGQEQPNKAV
jgi:hypothetical protein